MGRPGMCLVALLIIAPVLGYASPPPPTFGVTAPITKIADLDSGGFYSTGTHGLVSYNGEIFAGFLAQYTPYNDSQVRIGLSSDGGLTWPGTLFVAQINPWWSGGDEVAIAAGPDPYWGGTRLHVLWSQGGQIMYSHSDPLSVGRFSTPVPISGAPGPRFSIAADSNYGVHVASWDGTNIYYSRSSDGGASFIETGTVILQSPNGYPSIAADPAGDVFVVSENLQYTRKLAGTTNWSAPVSLPVSGMSPYGEASIAALDANQV